MNNNTSPPTQKGRDFNILWKLPAQDEYGEYKHKYPVKNWTFEGFQRFSFLKPIHALAHTKSILAFSQELGEQRVLTNNLLYANTAVSAVVAPLAFKSSFIRTYAILPVLTSWYLYAYMYDLSYGGMLKRISWETHKILTTSL